MKRIEKARCKYLRIMEMNALMKEEMTKIQVAVLAQAKSDSDVNIN